MRAMVLDAARQPLREADLPDPEPGPGQVLVSVSACGVCRTDLHVVDGELGSALTHERALPGRAASNRSPKLPLVLGHQVVGTVAGGGERFAPGERIGIPWLGW